ncbi:hypothetical protein ACJJTC_002088 [Scirpophaga incertulas]
MASGLIQFAFVLASGIINIMPNEIDSEGQKSYEAPVFQLFDRKESEVSNQMAALAAHIIAPTAEHPSTQSAPYLGAVRDPGEEFVNILTPLARTVIDRCWRSFVTRCSRSSYVSLRSLG